MAPTSRKRAGGAAAAAGSRPLRRARVGNEGCAAVKMPPIGENAELPKALSTTSTGTHFSESPPDRKTVGRKRLQSAREQALAAHERKRLRTLRLLIELEAKVEQRCKDLAVQSEHKAKELRMELKVQLMFLPESVRKMPWKTFIEDFGGSLENVIQNVKEQDYRHYVAASPLRSGAKAVRPLPRPASSQLPPLAHSTPTALNRRLHAFETPSFTPYAGGVPGTVLRTARKGETIYSIRGSPIVLDTVVKAPTGSLVATFGGSTAGPTASLTLDNETTLDLSNPDQLSEESRANAKAKLQALQAKLNALLMQYE
ncbi:hypothetical protein PybrP1_001729 [[Pythium] brassicae (nom. inval.)]|nr:hypothetical protein PybrP1_001729 [[Pythium] brassicae (nom. inval.)]